LFFRGDREGDRDESFTFNLELNMNKITIISINDIFVIENRVKTHYPLPGVKLPYGALE